MHNPISDLVKDKSVSIVGPDKRILETRLGERIDQSDLVIRIDSVWPRCGKWENAQRDIGHKTDIVALFGDTHRDNRRISELSSLKMVIWFGDLSSDFVRAGRRYLKLMGIPDVRFEDYFQIDHQFIFAKLTIAMLKSGASVYLCGVNPETVPEDMDRLNDLNTKNTINAAFHTGLWKAEYRIY